LFGNRKGILAFKDLSKTKIMPAISNQRKNNNWLLWGLIAISAGIHVVFLIHITGMYRPTNWTYIELTLKNASKSKPRSIPRPHHKSKDFLHPQDMKELEASKFVPMHPEPVIVPAPETVFPDGITERITLPHIPYVSDPNILDWAQGEQDHTDLDQNKLSRYLSMVRNRIEKHKKYPHIARTRRIEGRVTIRFVITPDGDIHNPAVVKTSRHRILDRAALTGVIEAAPFPKPPEGLLKDEIPVEIIVVFALL